MKASLMSTLSSACSSATRSSAGGSSVSVFCQVALMPRARRSQRGLAGVRPSSAPLRSARRQLGHRRQARPAVYVHQVQREGGHASGAATLRIKAVRDARQRGYRRGQQLDATHHQRHQQRRQENDEVLWRVGRGVLRVWHLLGKQPGGGCDPPDQPAHGRDLPICGNRPPPPRPSTPARRGAHPHEVGGGRVTGGDRPCRRA